MATVVAADLVTMKKCMGTNHFPRRPKQLHNFHCAVVLSHA